MQLLSQRYRRDIPFLTDRTIDNAMKKKKNDGKMMKTREWYSGEFSNNVFSRGTVQIHPVICLHFGISKGIPFPHRRITSFRFELWLMALYVHAFIRWKEIKARVGRGYTQVGQENIELSIKIREGGLRRANRAASFSRKRQNAFAPSCGWHFGESTDR